MIVDFDRSLMRERNEELRREVQMRYLEKRLRANRERRSRFFCGDSHELHKPFTYPNSRLRSKKQDLRRYREEERSGAM